jgi:quercetin dioxygenase-like cupin family protein
MKLLSASALPLVALLVAAPLAADPPGDVMRIVRAQEIRWTEDPTIPGLSTAVVAGDPRVAGQPYVIRVRFAPGTMSPPHFHPEARYIIVLKGTWWVGAGPKWDREATTPLPAGTFVEHHPQQVHYDGAKTEAVELQIMGVGPSAMIRVDETGKPRS